jgi:xylulokinase
VGRSLEWLLDTLWVPAGGTGGREALYQAVNAAAASSPLGAGGLLFFTLAGGQGGYGPTRGGLLGLQLSHSRDDIARAVMEGIAFELRSALERIGQAGLEIAELRMVGGAAKSNIWPAIVADVTGVPVVLPAVRDAASQGAALLASFGVDLLPDLETAGPAALGQVSHLEPSGETRAIYDEAFARYCRISAMLATEGGAPSA